MALFMITSLLAVATASSLYPRNNPPQPPCVYPYTKFVYSGCYKDTVATRALPFQAELEFNNATVEQCTAYCKGNNYRYAGLEYHGQCFCGASVSAPAAPEEDCNLPCNGDSTQACGGEDRVSVYQDPTFPDADDIALSPDYLSLGCYTEGENGRSLDYSQWDYLSISAMTTETCLTACGAKGFPFAGTEFGRECYCGVVLGNGTVATDSNQCSTPCTGNSTQYCGGEDRLSLYVAKNLESTDPCGPPVISSSSIPSSTPTSYSSSLIPSSTVTPTPSSSKLPSSSAPVSTSSKITSSSTPIHTTTSPCVGYHCPTTKKTSSSSTKKATSTSCKTTSSTKSTAKPTSTPKSTLKPSSSTKKSSTLKTTTSCTTTAKSTAKSTVKTTSTKKYGGW